MAHFKFEYVWIDGTKPEGKLRSKTKILKMDSFDGDVSILPDWNFDGSSTNQAEGSSSDCVLKPVASFLDPQRINAFLIVCEVYNADGTPHASNTRALVENDDKELWFGFEQEYVVMKDGRPLGFPKNGYPAPQGPYYCSVGNGNVAGREMIEEHLDICLEAGIGLTGINAEVMLGQWEYQVFAKGAKTAGDEVIASRYFLYRLSEQYEVDIDLHPKPVKGDWNGSGMHVNFSNEVMRTVGGEDLFKAICESFRPFHEEHIAVYGSENDQRLTGLHETQSINEFSYGVSDRGASIRIPVGVAENWKGYLEDRRPASNADPYLITSRIIKTLSSMEVAV